MVCLACSMFFVIVQYSIKNILKARRASQVLNSDEEYIVITENRSINA